MIVSHPGASRQLCVEVSQYEKAPAPSVIVTVL